MRRLRTSYVAVFVATIVTLFIVGACSQQPPPAPAIEPVAPPTSTLGDSGDELSSNQVVDQASQNNSTQGDPQTTNTIDPTATATQENNQTTNTTDPTATVTHADIETIIDGILAELLNDAITNRRDLEEELEADMSLLSDDEQALIGVGE
jgi:hypothetical protein